MLVLSRKKDESIIIGDGIVITGDGIVITVVDVVGSKVRIGIQAPKDVPVHRQEVHEAIHGRPAAAPVTRPR